MVSRSSVFHCRDRRPRLSKKQRRTEKHPKDDTLEDENRFSFAFFGGRFSFGNCYSERAIDDRPYGGMVVFPCLARPRKGSSLSVSEGSWANSFVFHRYSGRLIASPTKTKPPLPLVGEDIILPKKEKNRKRPSCVILCFPSRRDSSLTLENDRLGGRERFFFAFSAGACSRRYNKIETRRWRSSRPTGFFLMRKL